MKTARFAVLLSAINLALLFAVPQLRSKASLAVGPNLRVRTLELVDDRDRVRSRLNVESDGEVVLRLFDESGTIRVKLGASDGGSGLLLLDEATEPGIHLVARRVGSAERPTSTSLTLRGGAIGQERVITP